MHQMYHKKIDELQMTFLLVKVKFSVWLHMST